MQQISVTVIRVAYPPQTDEPEAWYILVTNQCTCKGKMSWRPQENEQLLLEGEWSTYHGNKEFSFSTARLDVPSNPRDQLHYVCTRTSGIGQAMEELIWQHSGDDWQNIQELDVPRLSGKTYANFQLQIESLIQKSEEARVVAALMGKGATVNMAVRAWETWEKETLGVVNADCYRLAELEGYSFRDVDGKIRKEYGIGDNDIRRIRAAVIYALRKLTDSGDTVVAWNDLYTQAIGMLGGYDEEISQCTSELFENGTLKAFPNSEGVSLASDWKSENTIWEYITTK